MNTNAPGTLLRLNGEPVTVLAESGPRTFYIHGHHAYEVCFTDALTGGDQA